MVAVLAVVDHLIPLASVQTTEELLAAHPDKLAGPGIEVRPRLFIVQPDDAVVSISVSRIMGKSHLAPATAGSQRYSS